jgi:hypothetical protein
MAFASRQKTWSSSSWNAGNRRTKERKKVVSAFRSSRHRCGALYLAVQTVVSAPVACSKHDRSLPVEIAVTEGGRPIACEVRLTDEKGQPVLTDQWPSFRDHFAFPGHGTVRLAPGSYNYTVTRGPEYNVATGAFAVTNTRTNALNARLHRTIDLASSGWYSGDLHVHRRAADVPMLLASEDLHVAPAITWWNDELRAVAGDTFRVQELDQHRWADPTAGEDEREGGALLYLHATKPLDLPPLHRADGGIVHAVGDELDEYPSIAELARAVRMQSGAHLSLEKPFWWDAPALIALGLVDSIGIAHNHMRRHSVANHEAWGRPCDRARYGPSELADAFCSQDIYYRVLDAGFRIAPAAGSASGAISNPLGYNRVYVHVPNPPTYDAWWSALRAGHSFVTNGPLLTVQANGSEPGTVFGSEVAMKLVLEVEVRGNDSVGSVELVRDGRVVEKARFDATTGKATFQEQTFTASGWFLVRVIADRTDTFRFASTAPFYVEVGATPRRVSRSAVAFFQKWIAERIAGLRASPLRRDKLDAALAYQLEAKTRWDELSSKANAD